MILSHIVYLCIHLQLGECPTLFQLGEKIPVKFSGDGAKISSNMMILSFSILVPQGRYLSETGKCVCACVCVCVCVCVWKGWTVRNPYM